MTPNDRDHAVDDADACDGDDTDADRDGDTLDGLVTHVYSICTKYSIKEWTAIRLIVAGMQYNRQEARCRAGVTEKTAHEYKNRFQKMTPQERGALLAEADLRLVRDAQIAREQQPERRDRESRDCDAE